MKLEIFDVEHGGCALLTCDNGSRLMIDCGHNASDRLVPWRPPHPAFASHHGRANGVCPELFDDYGCAPKIVVISDDYMQYDTQQTTAYYASKCSGIIGFRGQCVRKVFTTRKDATLTFTWDGNFCGVS